MRYCKKTLCVLLTFCMILSMLPTWVFAAEADSTDVEMLVQEKSREKALPENTNVDETEPAKSKPEDMPEENEIIPRDKDDDIAYAVTGGNIYFDAATGTITDCDKAVTKAEIPAQINGVNVTSIGNDAFYWNTDLIKVTMPDSVTNIGDWAFAVCSNMTNIEISKNITSIGD